MASYIASYYISSAFVFCFSRISSHIKVLLEINRKRLFSALSWPEPADVTFKEVIYVGCIILLCLIIKLTNIKV